MLVCEYRQLDLPAAQRVGRVHSIDSMGAVDGPGLRFVVFLQGCLYRCRYCHNPDTWDPRGGEERTVASLVAEMRSYMPYLQASGGGLTVTGGEPLLQADFVAGLFEEAQKIGIHTALDTNGFAPRERAEPVLDHTDLILLDLKQLNPDKHRALTGQDNEVTLAFARYASARGIPLWIRYVVVPGWSDAPEDVEALADFVRTLRGVERVELLPYHLLGKHKWEALGIRYTLEGVEPPSADTMARIRAQLERRGLRVT